MMTTRAREARSQSRVDERQLQRAWASAGESLREDGQDRVILPAGAPLVAAEEYVKRHRSQGDVPLLRAYRGAFYLWVGTHYREHPDEKVEADLYAFLGEALAIARNGNIGPYNPTKNKVGEVRHALRRGLQIDRECEMPCWLGEQADRSAENLVACRNGILNLETRELLSRDPHFFTTNCLPLDYDPNAPEPQRWLQFLHELWPEDQDAKNCLQEIFGYALTHDTQQHKLFCLVGPKRAGKGIIASILTELLGRENVVYPTLKSMAGEFGRWPLIDKQLAIIADARLGPKADAHAVAEQLLSISGGDPQTINRKNQSFWNGHLGVRFLITTNELPAIADASGTLPSRFVLLVMRVSFYGREDLLLKEKLRPELAGILNWALDGLDWLRYRGHFEMPSSSLDSIRQLEDLGSPVSAFLRDWCETGITNQVNVKLLYAAYRVWSEEAGQRPLARHVFGKALHAVVPNLGTSGSGMARCYLGVNFSAEGHQQYEAARASSRMRMEGRWR
jgi:putative DNA primase/helicase